MGEFHGIIEKVHIAKFRKFKDLTIQCGQKLTIFAGQNGTQKTTLLGLIAHPFSMSQRDPDGNLREENMEESEVVNFSEFRTIQGQMFQSKFANKFKFDSRTESAKDHEYSLFMVDKNIGDEGVFTLESIERDKKSKALRLWKKGARAAGDGYMHYPVLYLSLKRVSPIGEEKKITNIKFDLKSEEEAFLKRNYEEILTPPILEGEAYVTDRLKSSNKATLISHPNTYSALTVSAGQDNVGSILTAILSFKRLRDRLQEDYKGGMLFIDEIESTLYPAAQENLINKLFKFAKEFQLQIFCTTHSPAVIGAAMQPRRRNDCVFNYLKLKSLDEVIVDEDVTPEQVYAHLSLKPNVLVNQRQEKIKVYTEDEEARLFLKALLPRKYLKLLNIVDVSIGANELIGLKKRGIKEFTNNLIVLDGDQERAGKNILKLPGSYGPDKLLWHYLKRLPMDDSFWPDAIETGGYSQQVCFRKYRELKSHAEGDERKFYKDWFKEQCENGYWGKNNLLAFKRWVSGNPEDVQAFIVQFKKFYNYVAKKNNISLL